MNIIALLSLGLLMATPVLQASQYEREREAKEASRARNLEAEVKAVAAQPLVTQTETTEIQPPKYPKTQLRLKDLQAKIERLGQEALSPKEREALSMQGKDVESEIRKAGLKKLSDEERELYDLLMFGGLAEVYGEAEGLQGMICQYLTGWHEVGRFKGHDGAVNTLTTYQDKYDNYKTKLVSGGQDGTIKIWDVDTQTCIYTSPADPHSVTALTTVYLRQARILAVAYGNYIKLFTMQKKKTPTLTKILTGIPQSIGHLETLYYSAEDNGQLVAYNTENQPIRIWNIKTGQLINSAQHPHDPRPWPADSYNMFTFNLATNIAQSIALPGHTATAFSNNINLHWSAQKQTTSNYLFASGDAQGNIYIWDTGNPSCITKLEGHTAKITGLAMITKHIDIKKMRTPQYPCSCPCSGCKSTYEEEKPGHYCILSFKEHCDSCKEKYDKANQEELNTVQLVSASEDGTMRLWEMSEGIKKLPAIVEQGKKVAEDPKYLSEEEDCDCSCCDSDSDDEDEDEKESSAALRSRIKEDQGS